MARKQLRLAPHKTEVVLLVGGRKKVEIHLEETVVKDQDTLRYLGVHLGKNLKMATHVKKIAERAHRAMATIGRLMPRIGGPRERRRRVLSSVSDSIMLYGASIWGKAIEKGVYRKILEGVQRRTIIQITGAYRITSTRAL